MNAELSVAPPAADGDVEEVLRTAWSHEGYHAAHERSHMVRAHDLSKVIWDKTGVLIPDLAAKDLRAILDIVYALGDDQGNTEMPGRVLARLGGL